ncbi:MAG TPA: alpha/beta fold hydrolase [Armatimonadota bacterium]|nr:alpha/beta fold hydrolase [Armatimonadota bacterium]
MRRLAPLLCIVLAPCLASCRQTGPVTAKPELVPLAEAFVDGMAADEFDECVESFDAIMSSVMSAEALNETWAKTVAGSGEYKGRLASQNVVDQGYNHVVVTCEFADENMDIRLVYNPKDKITGLWIARSATQGEYESAAYADPEAFVEIGVDVNEGGEWELPGTLTLPAREGPFPVVVLVHGSGPQDRDETIGPNRPFRDLAEGLATQGIAVMRYEKRTKEHKAKIVEIYEELTVDEETVDDALAAVATVREIEVLDATQVYVLGHSLGGMLVPRIGARDDEIAGFVIMAGTARPFLDIIIEQYEYIVSIDGTSEKDAQEVLAGIRKQVDATNAEDLSLDTPADTLFGGIPPAYWLDLRAYDPTEVVKQVKSPILAIQGGRDYQVTEVDFDLWKAALAGRDDVTFKLYENLNHLFAEGEGKAVPAEYLEPSHVAEVVINDIAEWLNAPK